MTLAEATALVTSSGLKTVSVTTAPRRFRHPLRTASRLAPRHPDRHRTDSRPWHARHPRYQRLARGNPLVTDGVINCYEIRFPGCYSGAADPLSGHRQRFTFPSIVGPPQHGRKESLAGMNSGQRPQELSAHQLFRLRPGQFAASFSTPPARPRRAPPQVSRLRIKPDPQRFRPLPIPVSRWSKPAFLPEPARPPPIARSTFVNF